MKSRNYFEELMRAADIPQDMWQDDELALAEFQRRGFFLTHAVECPLEQAFATREAHSANELVADIAHIFGPTVLNRLQFSYKPRHIALPGRSLCDLVTVLEQAGWGPRLIMDREMTVGESHSKESEAPPWLGAWLGKRLAEVLPKTSGC